MKLKIREIFRKAPNIYFFIEEQEGYRSCSIDSRRDLYIKSVSFPALREDPSEIRFFIRGVESDRDYRIVRCNCMHWEEIQLLIEKYNSLDDSRD